MRPTREDIEMVLVPQGSEPRIFELHWHHNQVEWFGFVAVLHGWECKYNTSGQPRMWKCDYVRCHTSTQFGIPKTYYFFVGAMRRSADCPDHPAICILSAMAFPNPWWPASGQPTSNGQPTSRSVAQSFIHSIIQSNPFWWSWQWSRGHESVKVIARDKHRQATSKEANSREGAVYQSGIYVSCYQFLDTTWSSFVGNLSSGYHSSILHGRYYEHIDDRGRKSNELVLALKSRVFLNPFEEQLPLVTRRRTTNGALCTVKGRVENVLWNGYV